MWCITFSGDFFGAERSFPDISLLRESICSTCGLVSGRTPLVPLHSDLFRSLPTIVWTGRSKLDQYARTPVGEGAFFRRSTTLRLLKASPGSRKTPTKLLRELRVCGCLSPQSCLSTVQRLAERRWNLAADASA